ncbi:hypothetical protein EMIHUDRAFT_220171 [Emiliania huxleyi CCMP1516]|uniref:Amino acid transporter transmembrane domain-containing protein n=2 Tax=Emiliania huxleyi TaxID=2903 RepID=A0A0D3I1G2_EMIH1|nr:hypothetical protein EMIHUDRAFT_220171 [Emiliania huxleyi CCMP1516]EOD05097.1 hypothetical protein EMIHUDRAFT_220171 [Emiliania huxleyi CCMP1516]|eukprot:XP_005757526.1 hypothetical protein EMIHUDRAFT_220171 [Emiliania huxleyi CCMP1516]
MITGPMEFHPYDLPLPNQILPCAILNEEATGLVAELEAKGKDSALGKLGYEIKEQKNVFMWAMWVSISAYLKDFGYRQSVQVQYQAVPQDDGSLGDNEPKPVNVFSWVAVIFCLILVAFEILLLECMMVENFLAEVPHTLTWVEWWYLDEPFLPRFIWIVGKLIVIPLAIGDAINSEPLLSVVVISYFALVTAILISAESTGNAPSDCSRTTHGPAPTLGNALSDFGIIFAIFGFLQATDSRGMGFIAGAACLDPTTYLATTKWIGLWTFALMILFHAYGPRCGTHGRADSAVFSLLSWPLSLTVYYTPLYSWVVPVSNIYFAVIWQTYPYCLDGWPICFPHGGPCLFWAQFGTSLAWTSLFVLRYGCFLFPCACAPELPGWFFFPPSNHLESPLGRQGQWDTRYIALFAERLFGRSGIGWDWDSCEWEPKDIDYERFYHGPQQTADQRAAGWEQRLELLEARVLGSQGAGQGVGGGVGSQLRHTW